MSLKKYTIIFEEIYNYIFNGAQFICKLILCEAKKLKANVFKIEPSHKLIFVMLSMKFR